MARVSWWKGFVWSPLTSTACTFPCFHSAIAASRRWASTGDGTAPGASPAPKTSATGASGAVERGTMRSS